MALDEKHFKNIGPQPQDVSFHGGGEYAVKIPDDLPSPAQLRLLDEAGRFVNERKLEEEEISFYWRRHQKKIAALMAFCGLGILVILLWALTPYLNGLWEILTGIFGFTFNFVRGLVPV